MDPNFESRELDALEPGFALKAKEVIQRCSERKVIMRPFFTLRGPGVQASLYCRSRKMGEVYRKAQEMQQQGAHWLASQLQQIWCVDHPQRNPKLSKAWATNALPGMSWHQWGSAIDCYVEGLDGKPIWETTHPGYKVYAEEAVKLGLIAGANWKSVDAVHVQSSKFSSPMDQGLNWAAIEEAMIKRFKEMK